MSIFAFHLLNDYSGSPKVLSQLLKGLVEKGEEVNIVTCSGRDGFLSDIEGAKYHYFWYKWHQNPFVRLFNFMLSQFLLFFKFLFLVKKGDIVYINTVLPFGAGLLGKLKSCQVVYHIHETSMKPLVLKKFLFGIVKLTADKVIYVSNYLAQNEPVSTQSTIVIPNAIDANFLKIAQSFEKSICTNHVLMICSLKKYKGVDEFVHLATISPLLNFRLIVNASELEISTYFLNKKLPNNLEILSTQTNVHPHYQWADVVLNLSKTDKWIETFGLTVIEAMAYGLPVIVPPVGGIAELVSDGINGYKVDSNNIEEIKNRLFDIISNENLYKKMKEQSKLSLQNYSESKFLIRIQDYLLT